MFAECASMFVHSVKRGKAINQFHFLILCFTIFGDFTEGAAGSEDLFTLNYNSAAPRSRIALIIGGKGQTNLNAGYDSIGLFYQAQTVTPIYVNVAWQSAGINRLSQVADQLEKMLQDSFPHSKIYLFGFSFGAAISLKLSQRIDAQQVLLCSMSPVFMEDNERQLFLFRHLMPIFNHFRSNGLSFEGNYKKCIYFLYGDHDSRLINHAIIRNRTASFKCNETIMVKNAKHDISGEFYLQAIKKIVQKIKN
jgi:hypothetical protein